MKPYLQLVLFTLLIIKTIVSNPKENLRYLSETHFEFAIELYNEVAKSRSGNLVIAGHSVNVGMAMLFLGTTAKTKSSYELRQTLHYENISYVDIHKSYKEVLLLLSEPYYVTNHDFLNKIGLFVQKGANVKQEYKRAVREFYRSNVLEVDFGAAGSGEVLNSMNSWIEKETNGTIRKIVSEEPGSDTRLVIASFVNLQPKWLYPFDPLKTSQNGLFYLPGGKRVEVPMMQAQLELPMGYSEELEARTLELPLSERRMSMFVILPDYLDPGIHQLEANFTTDHVRALMSTLETEVVNVKMPRFRIEETYELTPELENLGVHDILTPGEADFGNMVTRNFIHLSQYKQRVKIETKEWGQHGFSDTEEKRRVGVLKQKYFEVDRAFIYFIWDYFSGTIILIGRVTKPIIF